MTANKYWLSGVLSLLFLAACGKGPNSGLYATVLMRDGTRVSGAVAASSPAAIEIVGDDRVSHNLPMTLVRSVNYREPTGAESAAFDAHEDHYHPSESAITSRTFELAPGTQIAVRNEETIDSARAVEGQTFAAEVSRDVLDSSGAVVIPRGANAQIVIRSASRGGRVRDASDLVLDLASVSVEGRQYRLDTRDIVRRGDQGLGKNKRTAEYTGGGAAIGALIGAIAGHGKGAAIGAGVGAGGGALAQVVTKGDAVRVPAESLLTFRLDSALRVVSGQ